MTILSPPPALRAWCAMAALLGIQCVLGDESRVPGNHVGAGAEAWTGAGAGAGAGVPSNEQLEEIVRWRLAGSFSDKTSDLMVGRGGRGRRGARPRPRAPAPEEQMVGDDPFARGPFTLEGFSREVVRPASREQEAPVEEVEDDERAYMARPYIQLYNQLSNLQLEVRMGGTVRVTNDPITRNSVFRSSFHTTPSGLQGVRFQSVASCSLLCLDRAGRIYTRAVCLEAGSPGCHPEECIFNTSQHITDVSHQQKLASVVHRNSSHQFYLSLDRRRLRGQWLPDAALRQSSRQPKQDWIFIKTSYKDLKKVFKNKVKHVLSARKLSTYCPAVLKKRAAPKSLSCWSQRKGRRACLEREARRCARSKRRMAEGDPRRGMPCSQEERDRQFGKNWRWNTRNCDSLDRKGEAKKCRRQKRKRCMKRQMNEKSLSEKDAKRECRRKEKKRAGKSKA